MWVDKHRHPYMAPRPFSDSQKQAWRHHARVVRQGADSRGVDASEEAMDWSATTLSSSVDHVYGRAELLGQPLPNEILEVYLANDGWQEMEQRMRDIPLEWQWDIFMYELPYLDPGVSDPS